MAITRAEKKAIEREVEAFLVNVMIRYEPEDLMETGAR